MLVAKAAKKTRDRFMLGYQFVNATNGQTPENYKTDPETGLRPNEHSNPSGHSFSSLKNGLNYKTIPPLSVWDDGFWFDEWETKAPEEHRKEPVKCPSSFEERNLWVCSGEGTPSNFTWRLFEVPDTIAAVVKPNHPMLWSKELKLGVGNKSSDWQPWHTNSKTTTPPASNMPQPVKGSMPIGVRIRCDGCGHWFEERKLVDHIETTCPGLHEDQPWGVMCASECGCVNLDQAMTCKPGFPRVKAAEPAAQEPSVQEATKAQLDQVIAEKVEAP